MPISYPDILSLKTEGQPLEWRDQDAMLYALGVGMGADPLDANELPFVYENGLKAVPTLATVVAFGAGRARRAPGINFMMVVHGDQEVVLHQPFPPEGKLHRRQPPSPPSTTRAPRARSSSSAPS